MRPAAPVKMTSGIDVATSIGMVDCDSRPRTHQGTLDGVGEYT